jgi:hypothetical protein
VVHTKGPMNPRGDPRRARRRAALCRVIAVLIVSLVLLGVRPSNAENQDDALDGVRFRVDASVSIEPDSPLLARIRRSGSAADGLVQIYLRVSANSREVRYFGIVPKELPLRLPPAPALWQTVWEESICHQRRGLPKLTVVRVTGRWPAAMSRPAQTRPDPGQPPDKGGDLNLGQTPAPRIVDFNSSIRHIGVPLTQDELVPGIKLPDGVGEAGAYSAVRAQTKDNRLNADLRLYTFACPIVGASVAPRTALPPR